MEIFTTENIYNDRERRRKRGSSETKNANVTILSDFEGQGEETRKRYRVSAYPPRGAMVIFIYEETTMKRDTPAGRQTPWQSVGISTSWIRLVGRGWAVSKLNDNRVSFFSFDAAARRAPKWDTAASGRVPSICKFYHFINFHRPFHCGPFNRRHAVVSVIESFAALGNIPVNYYNVRGFGARCAGYAFRYRNTES